MLNRNQNEHLMWCFLSPVKANNRDQSGSRKCRVATEFTINLISVRDGFQINSENFFTENVKKAGLKNFHFVHLSRKFRNFTIFNVNKYIILN